MSIVSNINILNGYANKLIKLERIQKNYKNEHRVKYLFFKWICKSADKKGIESIYFKNEYKV